jgi:hypothetical protein
VTLNGREDLSELETLLPMHDSTRKTAHGSAKKGKIVSKNQASTTMMRTVLFEASVPVNETWTGMDRSSFAATEVSAMADRSQRKSVENASVNSGQSEKVWSGSSCRDWLRHPAFLKPHASRERGAVLSLEKGWMP